MYKTSSEKKRFFILVSTFFFYYSGVFICHFFSLLSWKIHIQICWNAMCCHRENREWQRRKCRPFISCICRVHPSLGRSQAAIQAVRGSSGACSKQSHKMSHSIRIHNEWDAFAYCFQSVSTDYFVCCCCLNDKRTKLRFMATSRATTTQRQQLIGKIGEKMRTKE